MRIATLGRGTIGGGLADLWEKAGHEVTRLGRSGGDVSGADAVLVAVPGSAMADALAKATGLEGKTTIDATNLFGAPAPDGYASNAEYLKSVTGGPTAKAWNINFGLLFDQVAEQQVPPGNFWCGDDEAREVVEALHRDAGFDPVRTGSLADAARQEALVPFILGIYEQDGMGPYFYRFTPPTMP